jgi:hypothetical protein
MEHISKFNPGPGYQGADPFNPHVEARCAFNDAIAEALADAIQAGLTRTEIVVDWDATMSMQDFGTEWRIEFHDEFSDEGGDIGVSLSSPDECRKYIESQWAEMVQASGNGTYHTDLTWSPSGYSAHGWYTVQPSPRAVARRFKCAYRIRRK